MNLAASIIAIPASSAPPADRAESIQAVWLYFGAITLLLALFLSVVALVMLDRRRRRGRRPPPSNEEAGVDAWSEAGRRARSYGREDE